MPNIELGGLASKLCTNNICIPPLILIQANHGNGADTPNFLTPFEATITWWIQRWWWWLPHCIRAHCAGLDCIPVLASFLNLRPPYYLLCLFCISGPHICISVNCGKVQFWRQVIYNLSTNFQISGWHCDAATCIFAYLYISEKWIIGPDFTHF